MQQLTREKKYLTCNHCGTQVHNHSGVLNDQEFLGANSGSVIYQPRDFGQATGLSPNQFIYSSVIAVVTSQSLYEG